VPEPVDAPVQGRSRRQVLRLAGVLLGGGAATSLAGCRVRLEQETVTTPPPPTPDELARERAALDAERLVRLLDDVRLVRPDAAALLGRIASHHEAHLAALRLPASTTTPTARTTPTGSATTSTPLSRQSALGVLAGSEEAVAVRVRSELPDVSRDLARLLAGISASLDCHADTLRAFDRASAG
jgi:hypothetical protein